MFHSTNPCTTKCNKINNHSALEMQYSYKYIDVAFTVYRFSQRCVLQMLSFQSEIRQLLQTYWTNTCIHTQRSWASVLVLQSPTLSTGVGVNNNIYYSWFLGGKRLCKCPLELLGSADKITFPAKSFHHGVIRCPRNEGSRGRIIFVRPSYFIWVSTITPVYTAIVEDDHDNRKLISHQCLSEVNRESYWTSRPGENW